MNPEPQQFATPDPTRLYVENGAGRIGVTAATTSTTTVRVSGARAEEVTVVQDDGRISVIAPKWRTGLFGGDQSLEIEVELPTDSHLVVKSGSAALTATGRLSTVRVKSGSGDVRLDTVGGAGEVDTGSGDVTIARAADGLRIRSGSGDVSLRSVAGTTSVSTGSGDVRIGRADGPVVVKTGSGDLEILEAEQDVASSTGSGDVVVRSARRGRIVAKGASGDIVVGVPVGTPVWTDLTTVTGQVTSTLPSAGQPEPGADHVELRAATVSGDIALVPA